MPEDPSVVSDIAESAPRELEIKLIGAQDVLERAMRSPLIKQYSNGKPVLRQLHSVYFDTPESTLQRQGVAMRLRKFGRKWIQTVKRERRVSAGVHDRDEYESVVSVAWPSFGDLSDTPVADVFIDLDLRNRIQPIFTTTFRRTTRLLSVGDSQIEVAYDRGQILANGATLPLCELELELEQGEAAALFALAAQLCAQFALRLENQSKAERGFALLKGQWLAPRKARNVVLTMQMSPNDAFLSIASECLRHLQANEAGLIQGEDPEYLHQARVALRRLRAALRLFRPLIPGQTIARQSSALGDLCRTLGEARDWDVMRTEHMPALPAGVLSEAGLNALKQRVDSVCKAAHGRAVQLIGGDTYTLVLLDFVATLYAQPWLRVDDPSVQEMRSMPLPEFARRVLSKRWKSAGKCGAGADPALPATLHPLRIELKKLRYGAEFLSLPIEKRSPKKFMGLLAELQEDLGQINDCMTALRLTNLLREGCHDGELREAIGTLRGVRAAQLDALVRPAFKAWKRLRQMTPYWL